MPRPWRVTWRRQWAEVWTPDFQAHWRQLLHSAPTATVYHRPELIRAWAETCGEANGIEPLVGWAEGGEGERVLLPWVVARHGGRFVRRRVAEPAGQSLFGYHDPLVSGEGPSLTSSFWNAVRRSIARFCDQALIRFVHPEFAPARHAEPCGEENPVLQLEGLESLDAMLARCSSNHRGDVRRRLRRLAEKGAFSLHVAAPGEERAVLAEFRGALLPSYDAVWSARPEGNMLQRPGVLPFVERALLEGVRGGWAHYCALRVNGEPIAWHLGFFHHNELYWWIPAHDPRWEDFSPGKVLLALLIEHGIGQGWRRLHFLTGGHRYKLDWKPAPLELRTIRWHSPSLRGKTLSYYDAWRGSERVSEKQA
jgi:CelD/BcsL family acetyltransferase involved in cellulose biosynthesis